LLLQQQLLGLVLLTPAVTAGALGLEKEKNTIPALLGTTLGAREIVAGKLLGRLVWIAVPALTALPILVLLAPLAALPLSRLLLVLGHEAVLTCSLAAGCMLISILTRRTADTLLACYAAPVCAFILGQLLLGSPRLPDWLDPVQVLQELANPGLAVRPSVLVVHFAIWGGVCMVCLAVAVRRLRPACLQQLEDRPRRRLWAFRPPVSDSPIQWRERHVIGLAPLPLLRSVPRWMGRLGVLSFSAILAIEAIDSVLGSRFLNTLFRGEFAKAYQLLGQVSPERVEDELYVMGIVLGAASVIVVGVRGADSISSEKRRKTWEDLTLTSLSLAEIVRDKRRGILRATVPYLGLYALPFFALGALGGAPAVCIVAAWVGATYLCLWGVAWLGTECAASYEQPEFPVNPMLAEGGYLVAYLQAEIAKLNVAQRVILLQKIWNSLAAERSLPDLMEAQMEAFSRGLAEFDPHSE
jgi:hypothetical protein